MKELDQESLEEFIGNHVDELEGDYHYSVDVEGESATVSITSDGDRPPFLGNRADRILEGLDLDSYRVEGRIENRNYVIDIFED